MTYDVRGSSMDYESCERGSWLQIVRQSFTHELLLKRPFQSNEIASLSPAREKKSRSARQA